MLEFEDMVDWSLGTESRVDVASEARNRKVSRRSKVTNPSSSRKSRPLMRNSNQHLLHSGVRRKANTKLTIRKVKRDAYGNVMSSA